MSLSLCLNPLSPWKVCRMASSVLPLKSVAVAFPKHASSPRFFCSHSPVEELLGSGVQDLGRLICPGMVSLATFFSPSDDRKIYHSCRGGTGVFVNPTLIATSAHAVGHVSTSYESKTAERSDRFGSIIHTAHIGRTAALTNRGDELRTKPLAVNFAHDVAVLEYVDPDGTVLSHRPLASSPPEKMNSLVAFALERDFQFAAFMGNVRGVKQKTIRAKAPWPREDEFGWMEHDWTVYPGGGPPPTSILYNPTEKVTGSITRIPGGPWFNLDGEVVGISSWEVRDDPAFSVGFAVPLSYIRSLLDYAKRKGPEDPIVMDRWINSHVIDRN